MDKLSTKVSHIDQIERKISRIPQFHNLQSITECLNQSNSDLCNGLDNDLEKTTSNFKYEVIIESQRGSTISGNHIYSKDSIIYPIDPPKFQTIWGDNLESLRLYPDPGLNWEWGWKNWHVLMIDDVDEEGWIYSNFRFGSKHWSGVGRLGKFVRRRIWIRLTNQIQDSNQDLLDLDENLFSPLVIGESIISKKKSRLEPLKNFLTLKPSRVSKVSKDQLENVSMGTLTLVDSTPQSVLTNIVKDVSNVKVTTSSLLQDLSNYVKNAQIDRLKTQRILEFLFEANTKVLEAIISNSNLIHDLISEFIFNDSKLNFITKFQSKLDSNLEISLEKKHHLEEILKLFKSNIEPKST